MTDLRDLFSEVILDHYKSPRNFRAMPDASRSMPGSNPLCGDHLILFIKLDGDRIADISFQGGGCAISTSSASMMTHALRGKTRAEAEELFRKFHAMVTREPGTAFDPEPMGSLGALAGVAEFPVRVKCASLAWHTLEAALKGAGGTVSTE
ncbi:MAG: SUF system NifU family Fe-S cluster assembly protein [Candidatus Brocadiae bacterium]|nr:SUF system NifU family Fe-S cluster assembly protein [Candidatus Brocadiia bacterium]